MSSWRRIPRPSSSSKVWSDKRKECNATCLSKLLSRRLLQTADDGLRVRRHRQEGEARASLTEPLKKSSGRNSYGRITVRHRGGGNKRKYRIIDFKRDKIGIATVLRLEYDPNRSANIALIQYEDGEKRYILAPLGLEGRPQDHDRPRGRTSCPATPCPSPTSPLVP